MIKSFSMRWFIARTRAMLRRTEMMKIAAGFAKENTPSPINVGELVVDFARHKVSCANYATELSPKEFDLLAFLVKNRE